MLNLHHLRIFQTLAACESYSRAAERLGISQPAVSMQVRKLEESVGLTLVTTRGRQVQLTGAGLELAGFATRILRLNDEAVAAMEELRGLRRGRVRVAASSTPGSYVLPAAVAAFRRLHPDVAVQLEVANTRAGLRQVAEGLADLAVVGEVAPDDLDGARLEPLCDDCLVVVAPAGHPWAETGLITPEQLVAEPLILREEGSSTRAVLDRRLRTLGLGAPRVAMELGSTEAVKQAVGAGLGPAVLSGWAVRWELEAGLLHRVETPGLDLTRQLHLVLPAGPLSPAAAAFLDAVRQMDLSGGCGC